jgi:hypothetical protein
MTKDKTAGKFAWFCVGLWTGGRGVSKLMHIIYIAIIITLLMSSNIIDMAKDTIKADNCICEQTNKLNE